MYVSPHPGLAFRSTRRTTQLTGFESLFSESHPDTPCPVHAKCPADDSTKYETIRFSPEHFSSQLEAFHFSPKLAANSNHYAPNHYATHLYAPLHTPANDHDSSIVAAHHEIRLLEHDSAAPIRDAPLHDDETDGAIAFFPRQDYERATE